MPHIKYPSNQVNCFDISNNGIFSVAKPIRDHMEFWDEIFNEYKHHLNISFNSDLSHISVI